VNLYRDPFRRSNRGSTKFSTVWTKVFGANRTITTHLTTLTRMECASDGNVLTGCGVRLDCVRHYTSAMVAPGNRALGTTTAAGQKS
jgi:hypothetical protein